MLFCIVGSVFLQVVEEEVCSSGIQQSAAIHL